jgi:hypothetical protein
MTAALPQREFDWVLMKARQEDRARRYDTANRLTRARQRDLRSNET